MNNQFICILCIALLAGCQSEVISSFEEWSEVETKAFYENLTEEKSERVEDAYHLDQEVVEYYLKLFYPQDKIMETIPYVNKGDTLFYIFNFEKGWKAMSADIRTMPIIACAEYGKCNLDIPEGSPQKDWINLSVEILMGMKASKKEPEETATMKQLRMCKEIVHQSWKNKPRKPATKSENEPYSDEAHWVQVVLNTYHNVNVICDIPHLMNTEWGQCDPWFEKTPYYDTNFIGFIPNYTHCPTGCVAVAIGQVLYYYNGAYNLPTGLYESVTAPLFTNTATAYQYIGLSDYNSYSTRWSSMKKKKSENNGNSVYVADLMATIGKKVQMQYAYEASGTVPTLSRLFDCGISANSGPYNPDTVVNNLLRAKPVIISADVYTDYSSGHTWVIDGYRHAITNSSVTYGYYYVDNPSSLNGYYNGYPIWNIYTAEEMDYICPGYVNGREQEVQSTTVENSFRMNWGYDGEGNNDLYPIYDSSWAELSSNIIYGGNRQIFYNISTFNAQ
ncbi:MAG: C10 family peptidase [Bacteroidales bacterium]|nr:C10 family peptidase [Bacteroidales bacterium]